MLPRKQYEQGTNTVIWLNRLRQAVVETMAQVQEKIGGGPHLADTPPLSAVFYDATSQISELDQPQQNVKWEKRKGKADHQCPM